MKNLIWVILLQTSLCVCQSNSYWIKVKVQKANITKPGEWKLTLENSGNHNVLDSTGFIVGAAESSVYRNKDLAQVLITRISNETFEAVATTYKNLQAGDLVFIKCKLPIKISSTSLLVDLLSHTIVFTDKENKPYYSWADIEKGKNWEDQVLQKITDDLKSTNTSSEVIEAGSQKGKTIGEVIKSMTILTSKTFLTYSSRFPQLNPENNLPTAFENWVKEGSPDIGTIDQFLKTGNGSLDKVSTILPDRSLKELFIKTINSASVNFKLTGNLENYLSTFDELKSIVGILTKEDLGYFHFTYATALFEAKKYNDASEQFELASKAYSSSNDLHFAHSLTNQAICLEELENIDLATDQFLKAFNTLQKFKSSSQNTLSNSILKSSLEGLVRCYEHLKNDQKYIDAHFELTKVYKALQLHLDRGNSFWSIGYAYGVKLNEPLISNKYYEQAYVVFDSIKSVPSAVIVLCNQAINYRSLKDYKNALELGQRAEAYAKANLNDTYEAYALENILLTYKATENNNKALETALRLDKLYTLQNEDKKLAENKDEIASLYASLDKNKEAATVAEEAVKIYEKFDQGKALANAYWNAGYYLDASRWKESNDYYEKAFNYFKDQSTKSATTLLSNIGINYRENNDSTKSYAQHQKAVDFAVNRNDTASMIYGHDKFYYTYKHFNDYKGMVREAMSAGLLYLYQNNSEKASEYYDLVLTGLDSLINQYGREKKYKLESQAYFFKSQVYELKGVSTSRAEMLYYTGYYYKFSEESDAFSKTLGYYKKSLAIYQTIEDRYNAVTFLENQIAKIYKEENKIDSALYYVNLAIQVGEENNYWDNLKTSYLLKAQYLAERKQYDSDSGAINFYNKAIHAYVENKDLQGQIDCKKDLADLYNQLTRYEEASKIHQERLNAINKSDELKVADVYWNLAYSLSYLPKRLKESNESYWKAASLFKKNKSMDNYVSVVANIGFNYRDANDSTNAFKTMRDLIKQVKVEKTHPDYGSYVVALEKTGHVFKHFDQNQKALLVRKEAGAGYEALENFEKAYSLYEDAGKAAEAGQQFDLADELYRKSKDIANKLNDKKKVAGALWNIAYNIGVNKHESKEAIVLYEEAYQRYLEAGDTANASVMRSNVGQNYWKLLDFDNAIDQHNKAIEIATKGKYFTQVVFSWRKLADLYKETNNPTKQAAAINNAITALEILKDTTELITSYFEIGSSYSESQEISKAEDYFGRALVMSKAKKDTINIAWANYKFAGLYHSRKPDIAKDYYTKTIDLQRKKKDRTNLIYSLASQGSLLMETDRVQSENLLKEALNLSIELKDDYVIAYCHGRLYDLYRNFGKIELAHQHIEISNDLYKKLKEKNSLANNYISLANEYLYDNGDFTKSQKYMSEAKVLLDSVNNPLSHANFYGQQCNIYDDLGQYDLALAELDKAQEIYRNLKNDWGLAGIFIDYGNIYKVLSEYQLALKYQTMSDSLYQVLNLQYQRLAPIANIGDVYFEQGDYPKALEYFKRSLKLMEDNKDQNTNLCKMYSGIGLAYSYMTNYEEAEKWLMKGLETSKRINATRTGADILNYLGKLKTETKKYPEAEKFLLEAKSFLLTQNLMIERTSNATHLGHLYLMKGELEKAKTELTEAIELAEKFGKDAVLWEAYFRMGDYYKRSKNLVEAKNYLMKSVDVIDKLKNHLVGGEEAKKLFSSDKWILEAYEELIAVLLELGETEEAMAWLQKINENNVKDKIRSLDVTFEDEEKNKTLAREKELKMKLEAMEKQINAQKQAKNIDTDQIKRLENIKNIAEGDYLKFVNQTVNVQPELSRYFSNTVQPSQLKGKKKQIPKDMALVSYLVGEKQLYIFVATSDTVVAKIVTVAKEKIHRDVNAMSNVAKNHLGSFGTIDLSSQEVERKELVTSIKQTDPTLKPFEEAYQYLISPINDLLVSKSRLGIIPTGELNYIPFQLLGKTLKNGKFSLLINQFSMFYTNSTDMLLRAVDSEKTLNIIAFGNPDKTLPSTEKEVNDIKRIFPTAKVYLREEATEDKAKYASEEYNVMHFATHGNLDYEDFSKSYLTMAENTSKNEDGMLTLEELWGMDVMSHLNIVVLSACQTAVTKGSDESSPVSPASGFLQNGVKSVVASLWKVDDEATSILMNDFYKNIKSMDAVDAMRQAQSNLSNNPKFNHPYYWAAMVLIGDWR